MSSGKRRVVTKDGAGRFGVQEDDIPEVKPGTILIDVKSTLVSPGTELGGVLKQRENPNPDGPPRPFGYGNAGVVLEVGEGVDEFKVGQRVACMGGGYALHASHAVVPRNLSVAMPDEISFDEASFAHLAATALWAVRRSEMEFGHNVAVFGLGIVGQISAQIARASGAHVMVVDRLPLRLQIAEECGVDKAVNFDEVNLVEAAREFTRGHGMDVVIIAFGGNSTEAMKSGAQIMKKAPDGHQFGTITIVGGSAFEARFPTPFGNIDVRASSRPGPGYHDEAWEFGRDYPPVFVQWSTKRNLEECLLFAAKKRLNYNALVTHRMPLDDAPAGCEELIQHPDKAMGVILNP